MFLRQTPPIARSFPARALSYSKARTPICALVCPGRLRLVRAPPVGLLCGRGFADTALQAASEALDVTPREPLDESQAKLFARVATLMTRLGRDLVSLDCSEEDQALLATGLLQLQQKFLLVVVGEFNSGKSQFVNALLGSARCAVGVLPTTEHVHILCYGAKEDAIKESESVRLISMPVDWLKETNIVDTPGTNAVLQEHQEITEHFVPRSDLVLFVTSVERPFTESERQFLTRIRQWKKKVVIVLNKSDMLDADQLAKVSEFVRVNAKQVLNEEPTVLPLSAKKALDAKVAIRQLRKGYGQASADEKDALLAAEKVLQGNLKGSGFQELEDLIISSLASAEKLALKIGTPLGIAENLLDRYSQRLKHRRTLLSADLAALARVEADLAAFKEDMVRDMELQLSKLDAIFISMKQKTASFLADNLRLLNLPDLLRSEALKQKYHEQVNQGVSNQIEDCVSSLIEWLVDKTQRQSELVTTFLHNRQSAESEVLGAANATPTPFSTQRRAVIQALHSQSRQMYTEQHRNQEVAMLHNEIRTSLLATVAVEGAGLAGLGALSSAALLDWTGIVGVSLVAASGLYVFPLRRSMLGQAMMAKITKTQVALKEHVSRHFENELAVALTAIDNNLAPYSRFARVERQQLEDVESNLAWARSEISAIRDHLRSLHSPGAK